jgi:hypothetical protein
MRMEFAKPETLAVREVLEKFNEVVVELNELELVMIGGGTGDVHLG